MIWLDFYFEPRRKPGFFILPKPGVFTSRNIHCNRVSPAPSFTMCIHILFLATSPARDVAYSYTLVHSNVSVRDVPCQERKTSFLEIRQKPTSVAGKINVSKIFRIDRI